MTERDIARLLAEEFATRWFTLLIAQAPEKRKPGRPRLVVPEEYRGKYPYWRRQHGAAVAREMAGVA